MNIYDFNAKTSSGEEISLSKYKGKVLIIANTASKCGFTPQYKDLEDLYKKFGNENLEILAFPCNQFLGQEPGSNEDIQNFCSINYGVTFPVFAKIDVNGENADPIFKFLRKNSSGILGDNIKWNFTKFIIDSDGNIVDRYAPTTSPKKLEKTIENLINSIRR
ncbi:glutathione peroxidase [Clostridium acidisoli DSM 12555]|uniref:Glutathione peroxidase n=1 Tax=Clostridium acidisoli DSM 12555 TaxID=1121291 RepID=A0A1W1XWF0_9CLOT|nr:glutathione peroxidase [Clostridium acidisoli]SMC28256.1 glutathione peroxidase [Clostridium acidisoli DSM 12555]